MLRLRHDIKNDSSRKTSHYRQFKRVMEKCQNDGSFFPNLFAFVSVGQLKAIVWQAWWKGTSLETLTETLGRDKTWNREH